MALVYKKIEVRLSCGPTLIFTFRYKLLLEDVIKNTPETHSDKANLKEALSQIEAVAWHINEQLREHENRLVGFGLDRLSLSKP